MEEILSHILLNGYTTVKQHPEITDGKVRAQLEAEAARFGGQVSYHAKLETLTIFMPPSDDGYTPLQKAALFVAWVELHYRNKAYRRAATQEDQDLILSPERLSKVYRNVFPRTRAASVLGELTDMHFLVRRGAERFAAGPRLAHAFPDAEAEEVLHNELSGLWDDLKPAQAIADNLRDALLAQLGAAPRGTCNRTWLVDALKPHAWREIEREIKALEAEGQIHHEGNGPARCYCLTEGSDV